jgi:succinate dehydrogenase / fumarate reductase cytochrome b subunit
MSDKVDTSFFWLKRIHSLMGAIPLTAFLVLYFVLGSFIFAGAETFNRVVSTLDSFPLMPLFEIVFIAIPLLIHVMMGLVLVYRSSANVVSYNSYRNWMYLLQRVTGFVVLAFVVFHAWSVWFAPEIAGVRVTYDYMHQHLEPTWIKVFYIVGIIAVVFHLANGLTSALITWGITQGRRSQFAVSIASWILMIVMWFWGFRILFAFSG